MMIPKEFIEESKELMYANAREYGSPPVFLIGVANDKGQELAKKLDANEEIVRAGTLLMDIMLGPAMDDNKASEHVEMSAKKALELIEKHPEIEDGERENILNCIREHHGESRFSSLESEIVCNADCYKFASVRGFVGGLYDFHRDESFEDVVKLFARKLEEKWNALTLDICKEELRPQYEAIKELFPHI